MAQVRNDVSRLGGEYMIQDRDHTSETSQPTDDGARQVEQSQPRARQQGGDDHAANRQQGSGDHNASSQQGGRRRQGH